MLTEDLVITPRCRRCGLVEPGAGPCPRCRGTERARSWCWRRRWHEGVPARYWRETRDGLGLDLASGRWARRWRLKDKRADRYQERVTDLATGVVLHMHFCTLSEHAGHSRHCRAAA